MPRLEETCEGWASAIRVQAVDHGLNVLFVFGVGQQKTGFTQRIQLLNARLAELQQQLQAQQQTHKQKH